VLVPVLLGQFCIQDEVLARRVVRVAKIIHLIRKRQISSIQRRADEIGFVLLILACNRVLVKYGCRF